MSEFKNIPFIIDDQIKDGMIVMAKFIFHLATTTKSIETLYCNYEHDYSIKSAARDLGFYKRKAPTVKKIEVKFIKQHGYANPRDNH